MRSRVLVALACVLTLSCDRSSQRDLSIESPRTREAALLPVTWLPVGSDPEEKIDPRVRSALLPHVRRETRIRLVVDLAEQPDLFALGRDVEARQLSRAERRRVIARALATRVASQRRLAAHLGRRRDVSDIVESRCLARIAFSGPASLARELAGRDDIAWVWGRALVPWADASPAPGIDSKAPKPWAAEVMGAPAFWDAGLTGRGMHVSVLDSASATTPALLAGRKASVARDAPGASLADEGDGHGFGVLAAAIGGEGIGLAPEATWSFANPLGGGVLDPEMFAAAVDWLLFDAQPDVVIVPWDVPSGDLAGHQLALPLGALRTAGMALAFPAGNEGPRESTNRSPANLVGLAPDGAPAFSVGGVAPSLEAYFASSRGPNARDGSPFPQVAAPGEDLAVLDADGSVRKGDGTSYAAGYAAGALALLLQQDPSRTGPQAEALLRSFARDLGPPGHDSTFGHGLIDLRPLLPPVSR